MLPSERDNKKMTGTHVTQSVSGEWGGQTWWKLSRLL
jgi:hypothetical protein